MAIADWGELVPLQHSDVVLTRDQSRIGAKPPPGQSADKAAHSKVAYCREPASVLRTALPPAPATATCHLTLQSNDVNRYCAVDAAEVAAFGGADRVGERV